MERPISYSLYAFAFVLAVIVFAGGVLLGQLIDQTNQDAISSEVDQITQKVEATQLLMLLDENSSSFCPVYQAQLDSINQDVEKIGYKLTYMEEEKQAYDITLKKSYFVLEAESYLLSKKMNERCGENSTLLVYFYSNKNCTECETQGDDILEVRDELQGSGNATIKIYSFDGELGSPVADALKEQFSVTSYPSIIIDGKLYPGPLGKDALRSALSKSKG